MPILAIFFIEMCLTINFRNFLCKFCQKSREEMFTVLVEQKEFRKSRENSRFYILTFLTTAKCILSTFDRQWKQARMERDASPPLQLLAYLAFTKTTLRPCKNRVVSMSISALPHLNVFFCNALFWQKFYSEACDAPIWTNLGLF